MKLSLAAGFLYLSLFLSVSVCQKAPCEEHMRLEINDHVAHTNGSIWAHGHLFHPGTYGSEDGVLYGCPCNVTACLRICPKERNKKMVAQFNLTVMTAEGNNKSVQSHDQFFTFESTADMRCSKDRMTHRVEDEKHELTLYENGSLIVDELDLYTADTFCVALDENSTVLWMVCDVRPSKIYLGRMYTAMLLISVVFLGLTALAYTLDQEMRNLHGYCLVAHAASLMLGFLLVTIMILAQLRRAIACRELALLVYCFVISSFVWLTIMCFDIWRTFRHRPSGDMPSSSPAPFKKFCCYCAIAWGIPLVLFAIAMWRKVPDSSALEESEPDMIEVDRCWFNADEFIFIFILPLLVLLLLNIGFFLSTTPRLWSMQRTLQHDTGTNATTREVLTHGMHKYRTYKRLLLVILFTWVMVILAFVMSVLGLEWLEVSCLCVYMLQGVLVFLMCVWFTSTRDPLLSKVCCSSVARRLSTRVGRENLTTPAVAYKVPDNDSEETVNLTVN